jgi:AGCS family alanine or glycine:cation symporter
MNNDLLHQISSAVWGPLLLVLLLGTGVYFTLRLKLVPLTKLFYALKIAFCGVKGMKGEGDISHFQSLMTALAATIGTGNIAGVATAMAVGGPGALFWMWVTAFLGMATNYAESLLAVKYRQKDQNGQMCGGPMYVLSRGLRNKRLGKILAASFALFAVFASFGAGNMTQANTVAMALHNLAGVKPWMTGIVISVLTGLVLLGGIKSIGRVSEKLVPFMGIFYILGGLIVICMHLENLMPGMLQITQSAFCGQAAVGGFAGASVAMALQKGVARGVFSNEAGMGSAAIAAAAARTDHPARQGFVSMTGVFIDTSVICSITGMAIAATGVWQDGRFTGVDMTMMAFEKGMPGIGGLVVTICVILFAYCTIIGWEYFGEKSVEYLLGGKSIRPYRAVYCVMVFFGSVFALDTVWNIADIFNGLMVFPNLIGILMLRHVVASETENFMRTIYKSEKKMALLAKRSKKSQRNRALQ